MAERMVISGRGAIVVALATVLGAAAGASWQRRDGRASSSADNGRWASVKTVLRMGVR